MKYQWQWITTLLCLMTLDMVICEPPRVSAHYRSSPLVFKSWSPLTRSSQPLRSASGLFMQLRGSGSSNIITRVPVPGMMIKTHNPLHLAMPMRYSRPFPSLKTAPSTHIYYRTGAPKKHHFSSPLTSSSQPVIKFSSPGHKTAIKFKSPPPLKTKPEIVFEKVTVPKFAEPIIANEAAIHQIAAPNLSLNQLDNDLTKASIQAFGSALEKPIHQYQVQENYNDYTFRNKITGEKTYYAPDNDPSVKTTPLKPVFNDPLNSPSDGKPKPADVLYHSNIEFNASPLVQQHFAVDPFQFPVTSQPQLQQYHHQQSAMMTQGLPLAAYNPTYLVQMSNNLLGQYQQHQPHLFSPAHGYIDTSSLVQPQILSPPVTKNYEVASLGQILTAQKDLDHHLHDTLTSTIAPSTISDFYHHHDVSAASQNVPAIAHLPEPRPNSYQYSQNFIDLPDIASPNDIQNLLNYDEAYRRQVENDIILKEAHEKLKGKLELQKKQEAVAFDLHQHALAEKFSPLRIIVPDEEDLKKRVDDDETYFDEEEDSEDIENAADDEMSDEEENKSNEKSAEKN